jgi:hypothetical protein
MHVRLSAAAVKICSKNSGIFIVQAIFNKLKSVYWTLLKYEDVFSYSYYKSKFLVNDSGFSLVLLKYCKVKIIDITNMNS